MVAPTVLRAFNPNRPGERASRGFGVIGQDRAGDLVASPAARISNGSHSIRRGRGAEAPQHMRERLAQMRPGEASRSILNCSVTADRPCFGGKHHSTVIHSIRKVEDLRKRDNDFNSLIAKTLRRRFPARCSDRAQHPQRQFPARCSEVCSTLERQFQARCGSAPAP